MNLKQSLIENQSIKLNQTAATWEEAVKIGTDLLVASGAVEPHYYERIISAIKQLGPYIIIAPGFAMPHARPEDGVKKTAFALVTLTEPVFFDGEPDGVDVFFTLAGSNGDEHMQGLMDVTQVLDDPTSETGINLEKIRRCKTPAEIYQVIDNSLNN